MLTSKKIILGIAAVAFLGACQQMQDNPKQTGGAVLGGIGGGVLGHQIGGGKGNTIATIAGTLLGAYLGSEVGRSLDRADQQYARQAEQKAYSAPVGQQISWSNPETGNSGAVTPVREGRDSGGNACREYQTTINVGGKTEQGYGTACRQEDGSWKIVK